MPRNPGLPQWRLPAPPPEAGDLIAIGAGLDPGTVLSAYRVGLFPMPVEAGAEIGWWSPEFRGVLGLDELIVSRSLRKSVRRFEFRVNTEFEAVMAGCANPERDGCWIDDQILEAYLHLHELGWAHSVETWRDGELVGGLYGLAIGGLFAGESMFSRERDASKAALVHLVSLLNDEYAEQRLVDTQWQTDHLATLGVSEIPRAEYLLRLEQALTLPLPAFAAGSADRSDATF